MSCPRAKYNVRTGAEEARSQSQEISDNLGFLKTFLLIFGFVSLFVGAFIIFNSFSITVAQRTRELGLLRAMGASRRQVLTSVLTEGVLLGLVGSLLGLLLGFALAPGIKALFVAVGVDLPANGLVIEPRTIIVPLLVGTIVAALSSLAPAIRATRVPPMAALREAEAPTVGHVNRRLTVVAGVLLAAGVVLVALGLFAGGSTNATLLKLGAGTILTFIGVALLSPYLVGPMSSVIGWPDRADRGLPRAARARERDAPAGPDGRDGRGAHGRRRARDVRLRVRRRRRRDDRRGGQGQLQGRLLRLRTPTASRPSPLRCSPASPGSRASTRSARSASPRPA